MWRCKECGGEVFKIYETKSYFEINKETYESTLESVHEYNKSKFGCHDCEIEYYFIEDIAEWVED